ncbi:tRNA lysidine(34) synthetase TilS [Peptoniphilus equinus]|uniref:tRNA(Ile)-lysidine synthase n=1 Tax=Peptoniphilus equinus TaxID=3016343 RepID=A0ABY7QRU6_9FIRM|nr:tRNA lysidine(34) synthetase TilS [Peptoniphilus equinus]WBW49497.1 tRNA lysidine(34) synthetase TilS [Peptoniphilus equinus]
MVRLHQGFLDNLITHHMIEAGDTVVAAVSGGADSMFLLCNLKAYQDLVPFTLKVAHVHHGLRLSADEDAKFVQAVAHAMDLDCYVKYSDVATMAGDAGKSVETMGRSVRYAFFNELGGKIFTAHNRDDQVETILFRMLRGTGLTGLGGMYDVLGNRYKPMLNISRAAIETYLNDEGIAYCTDETNFETHYTRNKLRLELLPHLKSCYNSSVDEAILRLGELARQNENYIAAHVNGYLKAHEREGELDIEIDDDYFLSLVLRAYFKQFNLTEDLGKMQMDAAVNAVRRAKSLTISGTVFDSDGGVLRLRRDAVPVETHLVMGRNDTPFGVFTVEELESAVQDNETQPVVVIAKAKIHGDLVVRNRRPKDRFHPKGMVGTKKLKEYFIDEKIPRRMRDRVPLLCDESGIIWVVPYRKAAGYDSEDVSASDLVRISWEEL